MLSVGGRGGARTTMMLPFHLKKWRVETYLENEYTAVIPTADWWTGLEVGYGPGILQGRSGALQTRRCRQNYYPYAYYNVNKYTYTTLTFTAPDGTEYELRDQLTGGEPILGTMCNTEQGPARGTVFTSQDGAGITFISDYTLYDFVLIDDRPPGVASGYLLFRDGTRYRIDASQVTWIRDRNGNKISFAYDANGRVTTITDSLNRQVIVEYDVSDVSPYGLCDRVTFKGTNGQPRVLRVSKTSMSNALRSGFSLQSPQQMFGLDGSTAPYNPTVVWKLWLPNSDSTAQHYQYYQFFYDSQGELARIELPTGGAIEYDIAAGSGQWGYEIYRRLAERRVYSDGSTLENRATYSAVASAWNEAWPWTTTVTVDQLNASGTLLTRSKHYFNGSAGAAMSQNPGNRRYIYPAWNEGQEYQTEVFALDGTTVLRRVNNTSQQRAAVPWWSSWVSEQGLNSAREPACDPRLIQVVSTLVDSNQVSQESFSYDQYNNQTDAYAYDFGNGAVGALVKHSHTDYLTTNPVNGADYTNTGIYMLSLPTQTSLYDAGGTERARTTFEYDNYLTDSNHAALTDRPSISGFDSSFNTSYTTRGNATATTHYLLVNGSVTSSVLAYAQFDIAGNTVKTIDSRGYTTVLEYDDRFGGADGDARANTSPAELLGAGQTTYAFVTKITNAAGQISYSQHDYYTGLPVDGEDTNGVVTSGYCNDLLDRPTQIIHGSNQPVSIKSQTTFAYDDLNRAITTTSDRDNFNDNILKGAILYDGLGRTTETRQYETSTTYITTKQNYDALGRAYQGSNPYRAGETVYWTTTALDSLSRVISITTPDNAVAASSYYGNSVTVTDQAGKARKSVSDALGRLTNVYEDPSGLNYQTSYSYDVLNELTTVSQGAQTRTFVYDSLKRLTSATNPESGTVSYTYDNNSNLLTRTDARSITTTIAYDALNRPTSKTYQNDGGITPAVSYFYDNQTLPSGAPSFDRGYSTGALVAVTYGGTSAGTYRGYDALGRVVRQYQQTDSVNYLVEAAYNASGMTSETYPSVPGASDRRTVSYTPDGAGRLYSLASSATSYAAGASVSGIGYASHNALSAETYGNNLVHAVGYNVRLQANEIKLGTSGNPTSVLDLTYNYGTTNNNGNLQSTSYSGGGLSYTQTFGYDSLNRLATAQENNGTSWSQTNGYDQYGNRWIDYGGGNQSQYFNASTDQISGSSYDNAGNLLSDTIHSYTYDAENRIVKLDNVTSYQYDGEGKRVRKFVAENTRFVYGIGGQQVAEFDGSSGNLKKEYVYGGGSLITIEPTSINSNGTQYSTGDHLGSPRVITNSSAGVVSRYDYMPFGEELFAGTGGRTTSMGFSDSGDNNRKKFTGYERDNETGLDFAQARYYSNTQGRFTSADPLMASANPHRPQTWNRYSYVLNNPLRFTDPSGMAHAQLNQVSKGGESFYGASSREDFVTGGSDYYENTVDGRLTESVSVTVSETDADGDLNSASSDSGTITGTVTDAPQSAGTILIIVGDPGLGRHNQGRNFDRAAETKRQELTAQGYTVIVRRASSIDDFNRELVNNGMLDGVEYLGHATSHSLSVGEGADPRTNIDLSNVSELSNAKLNPNAYIKINSCYTGAGGWGAIAGSMANHMDRSVFAFNGPTIFSGNEHQRTAGKFAPSTGPLYLIEDRGTRLLEYRPYRP